MPHQRAGSPHDDSQTFRGYSISSLASNTRTKINWSVADRLILLRHAARYQISSREMLDTGIDELTDDLGISSRSHRYRTVVLRRARSALEYLVCTRLRNDNVLILKTTDDPASGESEMKWRWPQYTLQWLRADWNGREQVPPGDSRSTLRQDLPGRRATTPGPNECMSQIENPETAAEEKAFMSSPWAEDDCASPAWSDGGRSASPTHNFGKYLETTSLPGSFPPPPSRSPSPILVNNAVEPSDASKRDYDEPPPVTPRYSTKMGSRKVSALQPAVKSQPRTPIVPRQADEAEKGKRPIYTGWHNLNFNNFREGHRPKMPYHELPSPPSGLPSAFDDPKNWPDTPTHEPRHSDERVVDAQSLPSGYQERRGRHMSAISEAPGDVVYPSLPPLGSFMDDAPLRHQPAPWNFSQTAQLSREAASLAQLSLGYAVQEWHAQFEAAAAVAMCDTQKQVAQECAARVAATKRINAGKMAIQHLLKRSREPDTAPAIVVSPIWEWLLRIPAEDT